MKRTLCVAAVALTLALAGCGESGRMDVTRRSANSDGTYSGYDNGAYGTGSGGTYGNGSYDGYDARSGDSMLEDAGNAVRDGMNSAGNAIRNGVNDVRNAAR